MTSWAEHQKAGRRNGERYWSHPQWAINFLKTVQKRLHKNSTTDNLAGSSVTGKIPEHTNQFPEYSCFLSAPTQETLMIVTGRGFLVVHRAIPIFKSYPCKYLSTALNQQYFAFNQENLFNSNLS